MLTYKVKHNHDFTDELKKAQKVSEYAVEHRSRSSKDVKHIGLKSAISNQILKKYGSNKNIKQVKHAVLVVPNQAIKVDKCKHIITITPLKISFEYRFPDNFEKVNQIEINDTYYCVSCTIKEAPEMIPQSFVGVDRNTTGHIVVVGHPDTGKVWKLGKRAHHVHQKYKGIRRSLQKRGKFKHLKKVKTRESRIVRDINHKASRKVIQIAQKLNAGIVLEELGGIRNTSKSRRSFRYSLHSWSFYQMEQFIRYKAKLLGIPVYQVDPAYTSQSCSRCGHIGIRNKKSFKCPECGHVDNADANASFNIALRQQRVVDCVQTEMHTMGALIPRWSNGSEGEPTLEPPML